MSFAAAKSLQSCLTLCNPIDGSPLGSPVPGILQARTVAISFSNAWKWKVKVKLLSHVRLLATSWTVAHQAPPSMGFSRQECWSGVPLPSPSGIRIVHLTWNCVLLLHSHYPLLWLVPFEASSALTFERPLWKTSRASFNYDNGFYQIISNWFLYRLLFNTLGQCPEAIVNGDIGESGL